MTYQKIGLLTSLFFSSFVFAQDFEFEGEIHQQVPKKNIIKSFHHSNASQSQNSDSVTVLKMHLSDRAWDKINENVSETATEAPVEKTGDKNGVQLGMGNVPVLDQGPHGTCVTFAATGAIDALLEEGDYISQFCQLQLGSYLEKNGYTSSGWSGSFGNIVLNQMQSFGIITKDTQTNVGCGGYKEYPSWTSDIPNDSLSLVDYHDLSIPLSERIGWTNIIDYYSFFKQETTPEQTLNQVKNTLKSGDRMIFGALLFRVDLGVAGAVGKHKVMNDTWVFTPEVKKAIEERDEQVGGHEMIITGYDDNAVAFDSTGQAHKGLLTLRNSWGEKYGNGGTFYMSYDYFKTLAVEVIRIRKLY